MIVKVDICDDEGPAHETGPWADIRSNTGRVVLFEGAR